MNNPITLEVADKKQKAVTVPTASALQKLVDQEVENRKILTKFITEHMKEGVDYGKIHISNKCDNKYDCKNQYHYSKACLFKPGSEKFSSLMKLRAEYHKDSDTWEMAGSTPGLFAYVCYLKDQKGNTVGEGRGCASIAEKTNANTAIKIAEKRAKIDAVLSTGGLSDFFTQDLDDMSFDATPPPDAKTPSQFPMTQKQANFITALLVQKGKTNEELDEVIRRLFKSTYEKLTADQASQIIERLNNLPDYKEEILDEEIDLDEVDKGIEEMNKK